MSPDRYHASPGQTRLVTLADGSLIHMNSGSSMRVHAAYERERIVDLDGEAYFEVAPAGRPFEVRTFNGSIEVLGTAFNVRAWKSSVDPATVVALQHGRLLLRPAEGAPVEMAPGEVRRIGGRRATEAAVDTLLARSATAWRNGDLIFRDEWLGVVLEEIERRFAVDIELHSNELMNREITWAERNATDVTAVLDNLCRALGVRYRRTAQGYEIYHR